ncbi:hypothetical protein [Streptomyces sp. YIM S03343]
MTEDLSGWTAHGCAVVLVDQQAEVGVVDAEQRAAAATLEGR